MGDFDIRLVGSRDKRDWRELFDGYAAFYGVPLIDATAWRVWRWLRDPEHALEGLIARDAHGRAVGLAHVRACPRPLGGCEIGFLDDLFVSPGQRGKGAADALFEGLRELARQRRWPTIRWLTERGNERGRAFYDRYTGGPSGFILYQWDLGSARPS